MGFYLTTAIQFISLISQSILLICYDHIILFQINGVVQPKNTVGNVNLDCSQKNHLPFQRGQKNFEGYLILHCHVLLCFIQCICQCLLNKYFLSSSYSFGAGKHRFLYDLYSQIEYPLVFQSYIHIFVMVISTEINMRLCLDNLQKDHCVKTNFQHWASDDKY